MKHGAEAGGRPHLIAVVEDDPGLGKALPRLLTTLGYRAELFATAAAFLSAAASTDAICLLVDVDLGHTSGLDLARRLSADGFEFPIIFMTGLQNDAVQMRCLNLGCVAFLRKPFSEDRLLDAIAKAIGSSACVDGSSPRLSA